MLGLLKHYKEMKAQYGQAWLPGPDNEPFNPMDHTPTCNACLIPGMLCNCGQNRQPKPSPQKKATPEAKK